MHYCSRCGARLEGGMNYCPSCGTRVSAPEADSAYTQSHTSAESGEYRPGGPSGAEEQENKIMAGLAYILFLIPLLASPKEQRFVRYHTNQGFVLFLAYLIPGVIFRVIQAVLFFGLVSGHSYFKGLFYGGMFHSGLLFGTLHALISLTYLLYCIIGIVNVVNGKMKPLPLIGRITLLK